jgi:hypothetical protein
MEGMPAANSEADRFYTFQRYTHAWQVGTGLRVSLAPGKYRVTGEEKLNGVVLIRLEGVYWIDVRELSASRLDRPVSRENRRPQLDASVATQRIQAQPDRPIP